MEPTSISILVLPAVTGAHADNCKASLKYCGSTLLNIGTYLERILVSLDMSFFP